MGPNRLKCVPFKCLERDQRLTDPRRARERSAALCAMVDMAHCTVDESDGVERSVEDRRRYRVMRLAGGVRALAVCDPQAEQRATAAVCVDGAGARTAPVELVGLAHYLEHMLFQGSRKYPGVSFYKKQIGLRAGRCNASTSAESTSYFFEVDAGGFEEVLDIFAQFFVGAPLLDASAAAREIEAVTNEDSRNRVNDDRRLRMALQHSVSGRTTGSHTWSKFGTGNKTTLGAEAAAAAGVEVRPALLAYRERFYRRDAMALVLISSQPLDATEQLATRIFGAATDAAGTGATETTADVDPAALAAATRLVQAAAEMAEAEGPPHPWACCGADELGATSPLPFELRIVPVKERRTCRLAFPLPARLSRHRDPRAPVLDFVTHLLGHEGEGSLYACLQAEGLATAVSASAEQLRDFAIAKVGIDLTPLGEELVELVLCRVFEYLAMLAEEGAGAAAHAAWAELAMVRALRWRFAERGNAAAEAKFWAHRLHVYGPQLALSGGRVLGDFPADGVVACLEAMRPAGVIISRESKAFAPTQEDDEVDAVCVGSPPQSLPPGSQRLTEPYYGVEYERRPIAPPLREKLEAARRGERTPAAGTGAAPPPLHLPAPNPFFATELEMTAPQQEPHPARLTGEERDAVHWHATEVAFGRPKAHVVLHLACSAEAVRDVTHMHLWMAVLHEHLATTLYPARLVDLGWAVSRYTSGVVLRVSGFSHKLSRLLLTLTDQLLRWDGAAYALRFEPRREKHVRALQGHFKQTSDRLAQYYLGLLLDPSRLPMETQLEAASGATLDSLAAFHARAVRRLKPLVFTYGNLAAADAVAIAAELETRVSAAREETLPRSEWAHSPVTRVPAGAWRLTLKPLSTEEKNSACLLYYQLGQLDIGPERAQLLVLLRLLKQPLFAELRTSQQLGYIVSSGEMQHGVGRSRVSGVYVLILSKDFAPPRLQRSIDDYLRTVPDAVLGALAPDEFRTARDALVTRRREPDRTLAEAFSRRWTAIDEETYDWARRAKLADALERVTLEQVRALAARLTGAPRVAVHVFGNGHLDDFGADDGSGSVDIESWEAWRAAQGAWGENLQG